MEQQGSPEFITLICDRGVEFTEVLLNRKGLLCSVVHF